MFTSVVLALAAVSAVSGWIVPRKNPPAGWATSYLEDYHVYHARYLALDCQNKHNTDFFAQCCHPLLANESLASRPAQCTPSASASASGSAAEPTSTVTTPGDGDDDDCDDDNDDSSSNDNVDDDDCDDDGDDGSSSSGDDGDDDDDCDDGEGESTSASPSSTVHVTSTKSPVTSTKPTATAAGTNPGHQGIAVSSAPATSTTPTSTHTSTTSTSTHTTSSKTSTTKTSTASQSTGTSSSSQIFTGGFATFFYQNGVAGACGVVHQDSDLIAAIDQSHYGDSGAVSPLCGKSVKITNTDNQKTVTVTIVDDCPTCPTDNSIDLSTGAFQMIAAESTGEVPITWEFV